MSSRYNFHLLSIIDSILLSVRLFLRSVLKLFASVGHVAPTVRNFTLTAYRTIRPLKPAYRESLRTYGQNLVASA